MIDQVRTLLLNPDGVPGYRRVADAPSDAVLRRMGLSGDAEADAAAVDRLLPLAMAPDLARFRRCFDSRTSPAHTPSVYNAAPGDLEGLYAAVLAGDGWWAASALFSFDDPSAADTLAAMRFAASSHDAPYALGTVVLACAYRRLLLQGGRV